MSKAPFADIVVPRHRNEIGPEMHGACAVAQLIERSNAHNWKRTKPDQWRKYRSFLSGLTRSARRARQRRYG